MIRRGSRHLHQHRPAHVRRGMVLLIVFILVASGALVALSITFAARAETSSATMTRHRTQLRSLAWSGIQAVMAELDSQRDVILRGGVPRLTDEWSLYGSRNERGVVQLIPVGPSGGSILVSESGKVDVNQADAEALAKIDLITPALAERIVHARDGRSGQRFDSIGDLLTVEGITPESLWGPPNSWQVESRAADLRDDASFDEYAFDGSTPSPSITEMASSSAGNSVGAARRLCDVMTIYSYEPRLQESGRYKINLNAPWSDRMRARIARRFNDQLATLVQNAKENDENFHVREEQIYQLMSQSNEPPSEWDRYIDAFTDDDTKFYRGRIDINQASVDALRTIEGMSADQAQRIVSERDAIAESGRAGTSWLVESGIFTPQEWATVAPKLTTRTFAWRVRILAEILVGGLDQTTAVADRMAFEAVVDLSMPRPRVAYLRDISMLETAGRYYATNRQAGNRTDLEQETVRNDRDAGSSETDDDESSAADGNWTEDNASASRDDEAGSGRSVPGSRTRREPALNRRPDRTDGATESDSRENGESAEADTIDASTGRQDADDQPPGRWNRGG